MKKIIVIFLLLHTYNLFSLDWKWTDPKNSNLRSPNISKLFTRDNGELWFVSNMEVGQILFNGNEIEITSDTTYRKNSSIYPFVNCLFDKNNNLICRSNNGLAVKNLNTNKWWVITDEDNNYLTLSNSIYLFDDKLLLNTAHFNWLVGFEFNKSLNKYERNENLDIRSKNLFDNDFGGAMSYLDSMLLFVNYDNINILDLKTDSIRSINYRDNTIFNNIASLSRLLEIDKKVFILTKNIDATISVYITDKKIRYSNEFEVFKYKTNLTNPKNSTPSEVVKYDANTYFISYSRELLLFKDKKFYVVKRPDNLGDDLDLDWTPRSLEIYNNQLFVGTNQGGIFNANVNDILNETLAMSLEEDYYSTLQSGKINVYPMPTTGNIKCEFYFKYETSDNLKTELYDFRGNLINNVPVDLKLINGELYEANVDLSSQLIGTYFLKIKGNNSHLTFKIIKE